MHKEAKKEALKDLLREMRKLMVAGKGDDPAPDAVSELAEAKAEEPAAEKEVEEDESAKDDAPKRGGGIVTLKGIVPKALKKGAVSQPAPSFPKGGKGKGGK